MAQDNRKEQDEKSQNKGQANKVKAGAADDNDDQGEDVQGYGEPTDGSGGGGKEEVGP